MKSYSEISKKYMKENIKRTILTTLGITLATILVFAIGTFILSFRQSMIDDSRKSADFEYIISKIPGEKALKIKDNAEVKDSSILKTNENNYLVDNADSLVDMSYGNEDYFNKIINSQLISGEFPTNENEVVIDKYSKNNLKVDVGDSIKITSEEGSKEYKISGIIDGKGFNNQKPVKIVGFLNKVSDEGNESYDIYVNLKTEKDKNNVINKVIEDANVELTDNTLQGNSQLLYLLGNGSDPYVTDALLNILIFVLVIIVVCTVTVIYNSFNISVIERIKYYGILKAIGATHKQIKRVIYKEGIIMGIIAFPIGCILGFLTLKYGIKLFIGDNLMLMDFKVYFYKEVVLLTAVIVAITIYLSLLIPARKAKKISAIDAMRNKNEIKKGKIKRRRGGIIGKIFGIEGNLAYKNIKRTPIRFLLTVMALTISIIMFNVFYGFMDFGKQVLSQQFLSSPFDSALFVNDDEVFSKEDLDSINNLNFAKDGSYYYTNYKDGAIPLDKINNEFWDKTGITEIKDLDSFGYKQTSMMINIAKGEKELEIAKKYLKEGEINIDSLNDDGVILIDGKKVKDENGNVEIVRKTTYKVGDKLIIPKTSDTISVEEAIKNKQFVEVTVRAILNQDPMYGTEAGNTIQLYFTGEEYAKKFGNEKYNMIGFNFDNDEDKFAAAEFFTNGGTGSKFYYQDIEENMKQIDEIYGQMEFFVYAFIIVISLISILNIFNTISTNLLLRKKEFSTLKAIGMTEKQLNKSVILEGTLYGIIASILGGIASAILLKLLISVGGGLGDFEYHFGYLAFSLSIVVAIAITYISTLIPLRRLKKMTIVEGISDEE